MSHEPTPVRWCVHALLATTIATLLTVAGCSRDSAVERMLADYLYRVRNATDTPVPKDARDTTTLSYPRRRDRQLVLANIRVGLLDFLALGRCDLQTLVGERNSPMGKVQPITQRLIYEHRFLVKATACRERLRVERQADEEFIARLDSVIRTKQRDQSKVFWNATFGSPEFEKLFAHSAAPLSAQNPKAPSPGVVDALGYLVDLRDKLGSPEVQLSAQRLEQHYFELQAQPYGGRVFRAIELLTATLSGAAAALEYRATSAPPLCFQGKTTEKGKVLETIFRKFYVERIGPYVSRVHRHAHEWLSLINRLAELQLETAPRSFQDYYRRQLSLTDNDGVWQNFTRAIEHHTRAWGKILAQCAIRPENSVRPLGD